MTVGADEHKECYSITDFETESNSSHAFDANTRCGWNKCKPDGLQKLNTPKWFLFFLVCYSAAQGMIVQGFTNVGLSTLEKQFKLSSKESGTIVAAKEISSLLLIAFLSYYGSFGHKPKYLAVGALVTVFGSLLYVLPHLLIGKYIPDKDANVFKNRDICIEMIAANSTLEDARCHVLGQSEWYYMFTFISAKLLLGAGTAPLFTLGAAYIDENVKPKVAPIYLGIWYATLFFGPGIGFVAGGSLLNVYVDLIQPVGLDLSPDDPRWIGAWWLGHFCGGLLIFVTSCALFAYPRHMPGSRALRQQAIRDGKIRPEDTRIHGKLKQMLPATVSLLRNPTYVFNTLALSCSTIIATGLGPFIVKYLQSNFGASNSKAGISVGITLIPGTAGGIFIGSVLMKRLKESDSCQMAAKYCFIFQLFAICSVASFLIPGCEPPKLAGIHAPYYGSDKLGNLTSSCNAACSCDAVQYAPVCGVDKVSYFAPCHAGCHLKKDSYGYSNCNCINPQLNATRIKTEKLQPSPGSEVTVQVVPGLCDRECKSMIPFLVGALLILLLSFISAIPSKMVVMRCVPDNERAYALGVQWIFMSLLGSMPGPVLFGIFIDKSCDLWEKTCSGTGNCLQYDNVSLSYMLCGATCLFQVLSALFYFLSWKLYKPLPTASKLLNEDCHPAESKNSVTISNITEGTIVEDCDVSFQSQSLINRSPLFVYESSI